MRSLHVPVVRRVRRSAVLAFLLALVGILPGLAACGGSTSIECASQVALRYGVTEPAPADLRTPGVIAVSISGGTADDVKLIKNDDVRATANDILRGCALGLVEYTQGECPAYGDTGGVCSSFITLSSDRSGYGVAFFQLQSNGAEDANDSDLKRAIDTLNHAAGMGADVAVRNHSNFRIQGASPNSVMLEGSQGTGHGGGSPDGPPTPATNVKVNPTPLPSNFEPCQRRSSSKTDGTVYVYVLDTGVPGMSENYQQAGIWPVAGCLCPSWNNCETQPLVADLANDFPVLAMGGFITTNEAFDYTLKYQQESWIKYHGLAVSELIHYQAPKAQVVLVPILNQYGIGTLQTWLTGLHIVQADAAANAIKPSHVLVNMSLTVEPPAQCIMDIWQHGWDPSKSTSDGKAIDPGRCSSSDSDLANVLKAQPERGRLIRPLSDFVQAMTDGGFTLVAAAGNDSTPSGSQPHYGADFPAVLCGVVSVAATIKPTDASTWKTGDGVTLLDTSNGPYYSPDGSTPCLNGDVSQTQPTGSPRTVRVAYALGSNVCSIDMEASDRGMGLWSGTSFAAALTSGNLAGAMLQQGANTSNTSPYDGLQDFSDKQPCG